MKLLEKIGDLGFSFQEVMSGTHRFLGEGATPGELPMEFRVTWGPDRIDGFLRAGGPGFMKNRLRGVVTVGGLCKDAPCHGTLELGYLSDRKIRYDFIFHVGEKTYRYVGEKVNIRAWNLPVSHTTCFGTLVDEADGRLLSRSVTHFRLGTLPRFLASARVKLFE